MRSLSFAAAFIIVTTIAAPALAKPEIETADAGGSSSVIVCKKFIEPGTLIKRRKICLTRAEWSHLSEAAQRNVIHHQFNNQGGADGCKPGAPGC